MKVCITNQSEIIADILSYWAELDKAVVEDIQAVKLEH